MRHTVEEMTKLFLELWPLAQPPPLETMKRLLVGTHRIANGLHIQLQTPIRVRIVNVSSGADVDESTEETLVEDYEP